MMKNNSTMPTRDKAPLGFSPRPTSLVQSTLAQRFSASAKSPLEVRDSQADHHSEAVFDIDPTFNVRHSNSEGLPEIVQQEASNQQISARDQDHFDFLN